MKKLILIIAVLFFVTIGRTSAQEITLPAVSLSPSPTPTIIEYQLPYPGILPGNPLYYFKIIRDRIVELFIADPQRKSNFYLLQADKHLNAGIYLFNKGDQKLSETTISKGQNYLEHSLSKARQTEREQEDAGETLAKIKLSAKKHVEVIAGLSKKATGDEKKKFENNLRRAQEFEKEAE